MGVVSIKDYIALARAGYKKADIDQIIALSEKPETENPEEQQAATADNIIPATASAEPVKAPENASPEEGQEEVIDYKALYEKSQEDLKAAQAFNRSQDASKNVPEYSYEDLQNAIRDLF